MKKIILFISVCFLCNGFFACKTKLEQTDIKAGTADFSRYVAVGNSFTAGYADGALSREGQDNSYPKMLADQFLLAGGGDFRIPYLEGAGNDGNNNPRRILGFVLPCNSSSPTLSPVFDPAGPTPINNVASVGPFNLVGIPGAKSTDANLGLYSLLNPFLNRICLSPFFSTMVSEAMRVNPTFFTLWLGTNDVLAYALAGAPQPVNLLSPAITDTIPFRVSISNTLDSLTVNGAGGAIANVPDVTSMPYFTAIPWNGAVLSQAEAVALNAVYASVGLESITWHEGANGFLIVDSSAPPFMRHANAEDLILLTVPADSLKCGQWGISPAKPLKDQYVLDYGEVGVIQLYTAKYNATISAQATLHNIALVDMNSFMKTLRSGMVYNGIALNAAFVSGGAFSLDGVHPNPRGYALIANEFIKAINAHYNASIPGVDVTKYTGIKFP